MDSQFRTFLEFNAWLLIEARKYSMSGIFNQYLT